MAVTFAPTLRRVSRSRALVGLPIDVDADVIGRKRGADLQETDEEEGEEAQVLLHARP